MQLCMLDNANSLRLMQLMHHMPNGASEDKTSKQLHCHLTTNLHRSVGIASG
jgi:hypothetical protein